MTGWLWSLAGIGAGGLIGAFVALIVSIRRQTFEVKCRLRFVAYQQIGTAASGLQIQDLPDQLQVVRDKMRVDALGRSHERIAHEYLATGFRFDV